MSAVKTLLLSSLLILASSLPLWADEAMQLKKIEEKQDQILAQLAEIKQELEVIKVRSSR